METKVINVLLPDALVRELDLIAEAGFYKNKSDFMVEAIKTLLAVRRALRIVVACRMYEKGEASLRSGSCAHYGSR